VLNPRVIFEVLSRGTEHYDRGEKREHYQQIPSLREYVLLAQDARRVELWSRDSELGAWSHVVRGAGEVVALHSIDCKLDVDRLYANAGIVS
jgi:Uma2 family endonuclease